MKKVLLGLALAGVGFASAGEGIKVNGALTTYFLYVGQNQNTPDAQKTIFDAGSALVTVSKKKGNFGYTFIGGAYAVPVVGSLPPTAASTTLLFSGVPVAYIDYSLAKSFNISVGRLPTIIGYETFATALNDYIQRGIVWNQQPVVHHGIRLSYTGGNISAIFGVNDGLFSLGPNLKGGNFTPGVELGIGASLMDNLSLSLAGLFISNSALNNPNDERDFQGNLIVAYNMGAITVALDTLFFNSGADETNNQGFALHAKYEGKAFGVAGRIEYEDVNKATAFTLTPSYKHGNYFVRLEGSYYSPEQGDAVVSGGFEAGFIF